MNGFTINLTAGSDSNQLAGAWTDSGHQTSATPLVPVWTNPAGKFAYVENGQIRFYSTLSSCQTKLGGGRGSSWLCDATFPELPDEAFDCGGSYEIEGASIH